MSTSAATNRASAWQFLLAPAVVSAVMLVIYFMPAVEPWLTLEQNLLFSQPWRIFTTHLVHLHATHLLVNLLALLAIAIIVRRWVHGRIFVNVMLFSALGATLLPVILQQDYQFVGLSGVLHGILVYAGIIVLRTNRPLGSTILLMVIAKLAIDLIFAGTESSWLGAQVAYLCHVGGAIGGAIAVPALRPRQARSS